MNRRPVIKFLLDFAEEEIIHIRSVKVDPKGGAEQFWELSFNCPEGTIVGPAMEEAELERSSILGSSANWFASL
jgi:hypothetical protein